MSFKDWLKNWWKELWGKPKPPTNVHWVKDVKKPVKIYHEEKPPKTGE